jgi:DNA-binding MarR family transcriptional regulator
MKGFYIGIKNDLLEPKHRKKMGSAVWEFMWLIDKTTSIDERGIGKVLGGKPIKLDEIGNETGIARSTISENIKKLEKEGYINIIHAPYGLVITVNKSSKIFGKKKNNQQEINSKSTGFGKGERPFGFPNEGSEKAKRNIRQYKDNTEDLGSIRTSLQKYKKQ